MCGSSPDNEWSSPTGRIRRSEPEPQYPRVFGERRYRPDFTISYDFSNIEKRLLASLEQDLSQEKAQQVLDRFNESFPNFREFQTTLARRRRKL